MERQDEQLAQLSAILRRQNQIGVAIGSEISQQIEMLDELSTHLDSTGAKLANTRKQLGRFYWVDSPDLTPCKVTWDSVGRERTDLFAVDQVQQLSKY
ncbi:SNARE domain-containing protein [Rhizoctonia solani AG-1 IA]|uniref:SNARE domain-containing protein n=1 Tax=Thanatephorus cucumeris (strain AG1-IA) TaxID=983506 RepID=L8WTZ1_THACA|nr:SNARE domain-containing protein [Rhizoctonia solani AG-1 IA]